MFFEGFENNSLSYLLTGGWVGLTTNSGTSATTHKTITGAGGSYCWVNGSNTGGASPTFSTQFRWFGFYARCQGAIWPAQTWGIVFYKGASPQFTMQMEGGTGTITLRRGDINGVVVATATMPMNMFVGQWFEVDMTCDPAAGSFTLYMNNSSTSFITFSGNTANTGSAGWNNVRFYQPNGGGQAFEFDDFVWTTSAEGRPHEQFISKLTPNSDDVIQSTSSGGGPGTYTNVDETPPSTTDYNEFTGGQQDTYGETSLSYTPLSILGFRVTADVARDGVVTQVAHVCKNGGVTSLGAAQTISGSAGSYVMTEAFFSTDPATGVAWTAAGVNTTKVGVNFS